MMSNERGPSVQEKVKRHAATVRMDDNVKEGLRSMTEEHPLYTESVIIRAALLAFLALSVDVRTAIILASLNETDVKETMQRQGIFAGILQEKSINTGGEHAV